MNTPQRSSVLDSSVESSKYSDLVAFTSTFYRDDTEGRVRSEAFFSLLDNAQQMGVQIVVGDGGSGPDFLQRVRSYPNVRLVPSGKGGDNTDLTMGGERRYTGEQALEFFPSAKYFLWLEPEKEGLMSEENIDAILAPMRMGSVDIVVPSRKLKDTLPKQQRSVENRANKRAADIWKNGSMTRITRFKDAQTDIVSDLSAFHKLDKRYSDNGVNTWEKPFNAPYDLWFGPKAFTRKSMEENFLAYKGAKWDGIITSVVEGILDGKRVKDIPVDFSYPPDQIALESGPDKAKEYQAKRLSQYRYILKTIRDAVRLRAHGGMQEQVMKYIESQNAEGLIRLTNSYGLQHGHQDSRRLIEEYNGPNFSLQRFTILDDNTELGHHYHKKGENGTSEVFVIEKGGGKIVLRNVDVETGDQTGEITVLAVKKGDIIVIPQYVAHVFSLEKLSIMRGIRPYPFSEDDMDLNVSKLQLPD